MEIITNQRPKHYKIFGPISILNLTLEKDKIITNIRIKAKQIGRKHFDPLYSLVYIDSPQYIMITNNLEWNRTSYAKMGAIISGPLCNLINVIIFKTWAVTSK